jgi:hypothetical protein
MVVVILVHPFTNLLPKIVHMETIEKQMIGVPHQSRIENTF